MVRSDHSHKHSFELFATGTGVLDPYCDYVGNATQDHAVVSDEAIPLCGYIYNTTDHVFYWFIYDSISNEVITYNVFKQATQGVRLIEMAAELTLNIATMSYNVDPNNNHYINLNAKLYVICVMGNSVINGCYKPHFHKHYPYNDQKYKTRLSVKTWVGDGNNNRYLENTFSAGFFVIIGLGVGDEQLWIGGNLVNFLYPLIDTTYLENDGINAPDYITDEKAIFQLVLDDPRVCLCNAGDNKFNQNGVTYHGIFIDSRYYGLNEIMSQAGHIHPNVLDNKIMLANWVYYDGDNNLNREITFPYDIDFIILISNEPKLYISYGGTLIEIADFGKENATRNYILRSGNTITITDLAINTLGVSYGMYGFGSLR